MNIFLKIYRQSLFISSLVCLLSFQTTASNYYWIGGSGNWSDLVHWATVSGGTTLHNQIPTVLDDVFFDANSFTASGQTINFDPPVILVRDLIWTGVTHTPTLTGPASSLLKIYGTLTFVANMNMNFAGDVSFEATATGKTITTAGKSFAHFIYFNGVGGEWTLLDAFTEALFTGIYLNSGTLNTNGQTVTTGKFLANTFPFLTRTLNMGSSVFILTGSVDNWEASPTNMTLNCGTSVINITGNSTFIGGGDFEGGGLTYYDLNFTYNNPAVTASITGSNTFHDVSFIPKGQLIHSNTFHKLSFYGDGYFNNSNTCNDLTFTAGHTYTLYHGITQTINGTFDANGNCGGLIAIRSDVQGSQAIISHSPGTVNTSFLNLKDIRATGGANFIANSTIDLGNNTGWTINPLSVQNLYWIGGSGNWDDGNHWSLTSGGVSSGCAPTPFDNVFFDAQSFSAAGQIVTVNPFTAYCRDMTWTGVTNNPSLAGPTANTLKIFGSLTFVAGMSITYTGDVNFEATVTGKTITMAGNSFTDVNGEVAFNGIGGEWTLQDSFTTSGGIQLNVGTLNSNNQVVNCSGFNLNPFQTPSATINMAASVFNIYGTGWEGSGLTVNCGTSVVNIISNFFSSSHGEFTGGNNTYYDVNFTNTGIDADGIIYDNNTFHDVSFARKGTIFHSNTFHHVIFHRDGYIHNNNIFNGIDLTPGYTYILRTGTTQTINGAFNATGNCNALVWLSSDVYGSQATISRPPSAVTNSFLILKDINATGGGSFTADNAVDLGNNTGWTINVSGSHDLYWVGGTGNWEDGNHWSLTSGGFPSGCSPTPLDNVFFDSNSFPAAGQTVTINLTAAYCRDMTWMGTLNSATFTGPPINATCILKIYGSLSFSPNMNMTFMGSVNFESTTTGKTITMAGKSFNKLINFNGIGGEWTLQDTFNNVHGYNIIKLNSGTLNTNDQTVNASLFVSAPLNGTARALNMGSSVFNLSNVVECWQVNPTNMTLNCGTSVINASGSDFNSSCWVDFAGGGLRYYDLNFTNTDPASRGIILEGNTFHNVDFIPNGQILSQNTFHNVTFHSDGNADANNVFDNLVFTAGYTYTLASGTNQTINDHWQIQGSCTSYIILQSLNAGSPATVTKNSGEVLGYNIHMKDIHATGGALFNAYNSVDLGGNTGWNFATLPPLLNPGIIAGPSSVCVGATGIVYHTAPVAGAIYYEWTVPAGATITSGQGDTLIVVDFGTAISGDIVVQSFNGCNYGTISSAYTITIAAPLTPSVTITANPAGPTCQGATITITATATTGSSSVIYDFKVNNISVQNNNSNTYITTSLLNNDVITCDITVAATSCNSSATAISNSIVMVVGTGLTPAASLTAVPGNTICSGTNVGFTTTVSNAGSGSTTYNFKVNGVSVQNSSSNIYSTTTLSDGDIVSCDITINGGTCLATNTATSNTISMSVTLTTTPTIFIYPAHPDICRKDEITFTSTVTNGGSAPAYHWKLNGDYLQEFGSTFTTNNLHDGDIVTCLLSSNAACIFDATPLSNGVLVKVTDCECIPTVPNAFTPNGDGINDKWIISGGTCTMQVAISVYNRYGSLVYHSDNYHNDWYGTYQSKTCPDGTYYYVIKAISQSGKEQVIKGNVTILK